MTIFFTFIKNLIFGGLDKALSYQRDVRIAQIRQLGEKNNIVKELELARITSENEAYKNAKEVRIATKDHWELRLAAALVAIPLSFHAGCVAIDTTYNMNWNIEPLPPPLNEWQSTIILGYLFISPVRQGINLAAARLLRKP